jgi:hypothetical protein
MIRYCVTAYLGREHIDDYLTWLSHGHIQTVVNEGGGLTGEFDILQSDEPRDETRVMSLYTFPSREALNGYFNGAAIRLRQEGITLFLEPKKVSRMERSVGSISPTSFQVALGMARYSVTATGDVNLADYSKWLIDLDLNMTQEGSLHAEYNTLEEQEGRYGFRVIYTFQSRDSLDQFLLSPFASTVQEEEASRFQSLRINRIVGVVGFVYVNNSL